MNTPFTCTKCGRPMEEGFVVDNTYGGGLVSSWVAGPPEQKFLGGVKITDREKIQIRTFRCPTCGFLESYAPASEVRADAEVPRKTKRKAV